ncbi:CHAP domain-containing protein, partial [Kitasatospora sp. NPDC008050]|uniref:CHAP domain-containing protein n=1 Tax=Kitasatospora sp. NPDC008050 TaxID=3364021 RepID=UPI0036E4265B
MLLKHIRSFVTALSCGALLASGLAVLAPSPANADALGDAIAAKAMSYIGQDHTMGPWNELWCGDFVKRVWTQEGVPAESWMSSFVPDWLQSKQYHNIGTYTPQPGDAVIWNDDNYNDSNGNPGSHISIVTSYANGLLSDVGGDQGGGKNPNNLTPPPPWWSTSHVNIDEDNGGTAYDPTKHLFPNTNYEMWVRGYISPGTGTPPPPTPATVDQVGTWNGSTVNTASPQSVSGTITLTATETKASRVLYYLDNTNPTGSSTPISSGDSGGGLTPPHKLLFNTTSLANGSTHTITAAAFDATSTNQIDNTKTMTITVGNGIHNVQTDGWGGPPADAIQAVSVPIGTTGKNVTVVSSTSVDMARAGLDNAGAGDQVWIDRSWNGGQQVGDSQLGLTTAPGGSGWPTTYYNFDDPTGGRHGVLRACASTSAGITCTPWIGQICRNGTCDGTGNAPADAAQAVSVPIGTTGKNVTVITSNSTGLVRGGLDNASNGDQVWMDRSWDGSTDRSAFDSQIEKTTSTGGGWPTSWINSINPDNNEPAAIRTCASTSAGITCTPWIGQICRNGTCDGTGNAPADAAQAVSVPIGTTGKNVTVITSNSTGLVRGGLDNASNGDQVWMDRSWDGSTDRSAFDSQIEKTTSTGGGWPTSWINSINPDNNEPAAIRACASTSAGITCTGWQTANMWTYLDEHSSITAMPNGDTQLVAYGLDHVLYHNIRLANGGW